MESLVMESLVMESLEMAATEVATEAARAAAAEIVPEAVPESLPCVTAVRAAPVTVQALRGAMSAITGSQVIAVEARGPVAMVTVVAAVAVAEAQLEPAAVQVAGAGSGRQRAGGDGRCQRGQQDGRRQGPGADVAGALDGCSHLRWSSRGSSRPRGRRRAVVLSGSTPGRCRCSRAPGLRFLPLEPGGAERGGRRHRAAPARPRRLDRTHLTART